MYLPHRAKNLKPDNQSYEEYFMSGDICVNGQTVSVRDTVVSNMDDFEHNAELIDSAWTSVQNGDVLQDGWADIAPVSEEVQDQEAQTFDDDELLTVEGDVSHLPDLDVALQVCLVCP